MLVGALVAEMVAFTGHTLQDLLKDLFYRVGSVYSKREDQVINDQGRTQIDQMLERPPLS